MKKIALFALSLLMLFSSCQKVADETALSLTTDSSVSFSCEGGSITINFSANKPWHASSDRSWCKVSPFSGGANNSGVITIQCESNPDSNQRSGKVKIVCQEKSVEIIVVQAGAEEVESETEPEPVTFTVSTGGAGEIQTKTIYSGLDGSGEALSESSTEELIYWDYNDRIRIVCESSDKETDIQYADYEIFPDTRDRNLSAMVTPVQGTGVEWNKGEYHFYALYPAPDSGGSSITSNGNGVQVTGSIPAVQTVKLNGYTFSPNTNHSYMYACKASEVTAENVNLDFKSLVTAMEFTFKARYGELVSHNLKSIKLTSSQEDAYLTGDFSATITPDGVPSLRMADVNNGGNEIIVNLPDGFRLTRNHDYKITLLALPFDQTKLSVTLSFDNGNEMVFLLEENEKWITCKSRKKTFFPNLFDSSERFFFSVYYPKQSSESTGALHEYTVYSGKESYSNSFSQTRQAWSAQFSEDGGNTWNDSAPSWLLDFTKAGVGYTDAYFSLAPNDDGVETWEGTRALIASTKESAYDLSMHDIYGNSVSQTTANCYVVSAPGWYKLPAVYGNALKDGADNKAAYTGPDSGSSVMTDGFLNHTGAKINSPWLKDNAVNIAKADLLWQDAQGLITDISYGHDYICFYVDPGNISQGNAVIAAKTADGTIAWSWHIWVKDNPTQKLATKPVFAHTSGITSVVNPNQMMSENLGFSNFSTPPRSVMVRFTQEFSGLSETITITQPGKTRFSNPFYQWGRKDPMLYISDEMGTYKTVYNINNQVVPEKSAMSGTTMQMAIQEPVRVAAVNAGNQHDWCSDRYDNLWNTNQTVAVHGNEDTDAAVVKTVYDPCPPGFKVPNGHAFSGFIATGKDCIDYNLPDFTSQISASNHDSMCLDRGFFFYVNPNDHEAGTIFFPALLVVSYIGEPGYIGKTEIKEKTTLFGSYWTAEPCWYNSCQYSAYAMEFEGYNSVQTIFADIFFSTNPVRSACKSIRPVKE